jgi:hypothetical protein
MNTYVWSIESLDCIPSKDGLSNVVSAIHWRCKGNNDVNSTEVYGVVGLEHNAEAPFVEYANLNKETVIKWAKEALGNEKVIELESLLAKQLEALANPPIISPKLPWSK